MFGDQSGSIQGSIIQKKVDQEIDRILSEQYERGLKLLTENKVVLDEIAKLLIEEEKINGKQLLQLIKNIKPDLITDKAINAVESLSTP